MPAVILLDAVLATGAGSAVEQKNIASKVGSLADHTIQANLGGTVVATAVTVLLEGSLDGISWFTLGTKAFDAGELTAETAILHVAATPVVFVRANLTVLTGGTAPTVTVLYAAASR